MRERVIMKGVAVCLCLLAVVAGFLGYRSGFDDGWSDGYSGGYNQAIIARQGVIYTTIPHIQANEISIHTDIADNITIKYLDDGSGNPGLVVKWDGGAVLGDNATYPITMIQRLEPWLREVTGHYYNVSWER